MQTFSLNKLSRHPLLSQRILLKVISCFHHLVHPPLHVYCCLLDKQTKILSNTENLHFSTEHSPKDIVSLLIAHKHTHFTIRKFQDCNDNIMLIIWLVNWRHFRTKLKGYKKVGVMGSKMGCKNSRSGASQKLEGCILETFFEKFSWLNKLISMLKELMFWQ